MTIGMVILQKFLFGGNCNETKKTLFKQLGGTYHEKSGYIMQPLYEADFCNSRDHHGEKPHTVSEMVSGHLHDEPG